MGFQLNLIRIKPLSTVQSLRGFFRILNIYVAEMCSQEQQSRAKLEMTINELKIDSSMVISNLAYDPLAFLLTLYSLE